MDMFDPRSVCPDCRVLEEEQAFISEWNRRVNSYAESRCVPRETDTSEEGMIEITPEDLVAGPALTVHADSVKSVVKDDSGRGGSVVELENVKIIIHEDPDRLQEMLGAAGRDRNGTVFDG